MANWASTYVVFYSENYNDVFRAHCALLKATENEQETHMRIILEKLNISVPENLYMRSFFTEISDSVMRSKTPHYYFSLSMEEAWDENTFIMNYIAQMFNLEYVYMCEEPGCDIFVNTDTSGEFIPTKYLIDGEDIWEYFETEDELVKYFNKEFDFTCNTYQGCVSAARTLVDSGKLEWCYVRRFEP